MNAKMMITDFCTKVPRAPVRRNTIMNVECYGSSLVVVWSNPGATAVTGIDGEFRSCQISEIYIRHMFQSECRVAPGCTLHTRYNKK